MLLKLLVDDLGDVPVICRPQLTLKVTYKPNLVNKFLRHEALLFIEFVQLQQVLVQPLHQIHIVCFELADVYIEVVLYNCLYLSLAAYI